MTRPLHRRGPLLKRDILIALTLKVVLLTWIYMAFFSPAHRPSASTATHLFDAHPAEATERGP